MSVFPVPGPVLHQGLGAEVRTARSGEEAQRMLPKSAFATVITDERMPGLRGTELLAWLREAKPGTTRVLTSAFHDISSGPETARVLAALQDVLERGPPASGTGEPSIGS